jgi:hypothetical protein
MTLEITTAGYRLEVAVKGLAEEVAAEISAGNDLCAEDSGKDPGIKSGIARRD